MRLRRRIGASRQRQFDRGNGGLVGQKSVQDHVASGWGPVPFTGMAWSKPNQPDGFRREADIADRDGGRRGWGDPVTRPAYWREQTDCLLGAALLSASALPCTDRPGSDIPCVHRRSRRRKFVRRFAPDRRHVWMTLG
jgi:hypothetical protein